MVHNISEARHFEVENHWSSYIKKTNIFSITERKSSIKIAPGSLSFIIYLAIDT